MNQSLTLSINLLPESESGRYSPVFGGTGCSIQFNASENKWPCELEFLNQEFAYPGEKCRVHARFFDPNVWAEQQYVGQDLTLWEGTNQLGTGVVIKLKEASNIE